MPNVIEQRAADPDAVLTVCDFSPPRGADPTALEPARSLGASYVSVAYHPGKSTTANSAFVAHWMQRELGQPTMLTLATRDMNRLALESLLLGAALVGLEHVVIVGGDPFTEREQEHVRAANDTRPSELIRLVTEMNEGRDFRGRELAMPSPLCVGATIDLGVEGREPALTRRKVEAGAQFFLVQPLSAPDRLLAFMDEYERMYGEPLAAPLFCGVQMLTKNGLVFGDVPEATRDELERGRPGEEIALEVLERFLSQGLPSIYLVPPIMRGGGRDYDTAARVLAQLHQ